jgi:hypothetical protein
MKKIFLLILVVFGSYGCIKKKALKYDPQLVGTWVSNQDSVYTWLMITSDGQGHYSTSGNDEAVESGEVKYSLFEKKMWIGRKKYKVEKWLTGNTDGISELQTKEFQTMKDTTYAIDMKMILKYTGALSGRSITFYRIK